MVRVVVDDACRSHRPVLLGLEQKNVIIQRDRFGYGLTVSGDNPVYVQSVRDGGAAHRAGINVHDQIIKVELLLIGFDLSEAGCASRRHRQSGERIAFSTEKSVRLQKQTIINAFQRSG